MSPKEKPLKIDLDQLEEQSSLVGRKFEIKGVEAGYVAEVVEENEHQQMWILRSKGFNPVGAVDATKFASKLMKYGIVSVTAASTFQALDTEFIILVNKHQRKDQTSEIR